MKTTFGKLKHYLPGVPQVWRACVFQVHQIPLHITIFFMSSTPDSTCASYCAIESSSKSSWHLPLRCISFRTHSCLFSPRHKFLYAGLLNFKIYRWKKSRHSLFFIVLNGLTALFSPRSLLCVPELELACPGQIPRVYVLLTCVELSQYREGQV